MSKHQNSSLHHDMIIQLEVHSEHAQEETDIADIDEVGRSLFEQLQIDGYTVSPAATGRKGGEPLFDILLQVPQFLHANKDLLLEMFDSISLVLQCVLVARERRADKEKVRREPLKITLLVDGKPLTIETTEASEAAKLVEQLQRSHPEEAKKVTAKSNIKIHVSVPKKKRRGSR